jgi:nicotinate phosphoribosyltransferase
MEGDLIFPHCPALRVEGGLFEVQLVETILLNMINYQSLVATKASRIKQASPDSGFSEFGLRRAPGIGGLLASRAAIVGGFDNTSNVLAAKQYGLSLSGTMSHAFVQSFESEIDSFRNYSQINPQHCTFLVDTFDTIYSGLPNAILIAKEMEEKGQRAFGVRIDSGDLLSLSIIARNLLDTSGLSYMKIIVSDNLDEYRINELSIRKAPIDIYGVGSSLVGGKPDGILDGVYKISEINDTALMKISNSRDKSTLPGKKQVYRFMDNEQAAWSQDYICLQEEHPACNKESNQLTVFPLLHKMLESGRKLHPPKPVSEIANFTKSQLKMLPERHKRIICPDPYPVIISPQLHTLKEKLASKS